MYWFFYLPMNKYIKDIFFISKRKKSDFLILIDEYLQDRPWPVSGESTTRPLQSEKGIWRVHCSPTVEWKKAVEGTGARQRGSREDRVGRGRTL